MVAWKYDRNKKVSVSQVKKFQIIEEYSTIFTTNLAIKLRQKNDWYEQF